LLWLVVFSCHLCFTQITNDEFVVFLSLFVFSCRFLVFSHLFSHTHTHTQMRHHVISILKSLSTDGKKIEEKEMIAWANEKVQSAGKKSRMGSFQDGSLKTGVFFIDLCAAIREQSVQYEYVTPGANAEDALANAKYVLSVARKLGAVIFLLPEDIVEVKPKMVRRALLLFLVCF
jgi:hypothetical protein